jgi:hypothetical protein
MFCMKPGYATAVLAFMLLASPALADIGAKPSMVFTFVYEVSATLEDTGNEQIECSDMACTSSWPLERVGPQGFRCYYDECRSIAYSYSADYHKLRLNFSDRIRESNVFSTNNYGANFIVHVREDDLYVEETAPTIISPGGGIGLGGDMLATFALSLAMTILIELAVAAAYLRLSRTDLRPLKHVLLANIITVPALWVLQLFVGPILNSLPLLLLAELLVVAFEAYFISRYNMKILPLKRSLLMSLLMNAASLIAGSFLVILALVLVAY